MAYAGPLSNICHNFSNRIRPDIVTGLAGVKCANLKSGVLATSLPKLTRNRHVFPSDGPAIKALCLAVAQAQDSGR
jgi:hypothetical protein